MKKYVASNVCLARFPIKCPSDGCTGKIPGQQANFFIDKKLQLKLSDMMAKKICRAEPNLLSEYVVDSERLHHHPALRVSHYYYYQPTDETKEGYYKTGDKIIYCLLCRVVHCAKCKMPHDQSISCVNFANQENQ